LKYLQLGNPVALILASRLVIVLAGVVASVAVFGGGLIVTGKMIATGILGHLVVVPSTNWKDDIPGLSPQGLFFLLAAVTIS
jgi:hypothetical protein